MKKTLALLLLFTSVTTYGQSTYIGKITDEKMYLCRMPMLWHYLYQIQRLWLVLLQIYKVISNWSKLRRGS